MQHCHDEHAALGGHDHDHNHDHNHDHDDETAAHPFKPFHERQDRSRFLASNDDDPEMIMFIPFTEAVSIKSICISGSAGDGTHPKAVKLFTNREDIDFSNANELPAQQKLDLAEDDTANIDYPLQVRKFQGVSSLTLFIEDSYGGDETKIYYIGLKGENKKWRHGVVECVYEARPQPADHKVKDAIGSTSLI
ncbi:hypothetical protein PC129_g4607 [Phytophthora cactorum]|uniref:PITH domain-containing protein n=1 Tax=Phytophthora cactorum TaxID=29920 RepID=A0A8T1E8P4_9STRA|nr:hypothetical protein PC112_g6654 [Phytophthora cactorum]KAG2835216.1 hypothetical protein PC111_g5529 [Phytophthora cactorum]KAG2860118.1 hypothetical protein PC113_g8332 [Phytophthora cactorum]KAG2913588.1 hypothetical protein PC114_g8523 [Phytophthora cactorum]KAG2928486.1 hypothetical protein PC115_g7199 [Phytophthora cactorum]